MTATRDQSIWAFRSEAPDMSALDLDIAFPVPCAAEEHPDLGSLRGAFAVLDPHVRRLAEQTRSALRGFEQSIPGDLTDDYSAAFVASGAAALHAAVAELVTVLDHAVSDLYP